MMNIQKLQAIIRVEPQANNFGLNNRGYHSIRQPQRSFASGNIDGCGTDSGLSYPGFDRYADVERVMGVVIFPPGPVRREIVFRLRQPFAPELSPRKLNDGAMVILPAADRAPILSREELDSKRLK